MIILKIQIYSLLYSFLFGMIFYLGLRINYKYIYDVKLVIRIIISFVFVMLNVIIFFMGLKFINNGILHLYFFLCILFGYYFMNWIFSKFTVKKSKL
jgi:hypothetical protein